MTQKVVTPSPMTDGQIDKAAGQYRDMLSKHRDEIGSSEAVQQVLGSPEYLEEQLAVIRKRAEAVSNLIVRRARVDRSRSPQKALDATGRKQYTAEKVVETMPRGEGEEVEVYFFKIGRYVGDDQLEKEYDLRGLKAVDPYSLASVNAADQEFADEHPNGTHWRDASGKWCYVAFLNWGGERGVDVDRDDDDWNGGWWFAGLRK